RRRAGHGHREPPGADREAPAIPRIRGAAINLMFFLDLDATSRFMMKSSGGGGMYTVQKLATLAGVSARTLRYYDSIGLLTPKKNESGYRVYGSAETDRLQLI